MPSPFDPTGESSHDGLGEDKPKKSKPKLATVGGTDVPPPPDDAEERTEDPFLPAKYSEEQSALRFTQRYGNSLRYVAAWGKWLEWDGKRWQIDSVLRIFDLVRVVCRDISIFANNDPFLTPHQQNKVSSLYGAGKTIAAIEKILRSDSRHASKPEDWDKDIWALNTPDGVVNLKTGELRPAKIEDYSTKSTSLAPAKEANCPCWHAFLDTVTGNDPELKKFLQRMAGYSLTGSIKEHALFFLYGTGGNGKGTFLGIVQHILADYAQVAGMDVFIEQRGNRHPTEVASLMGARLVTAQETEEGRRWAESRIKTMTGGDLIRARYMRMDEFTFAPQFKLVIAGNHKPGLRNVDEAIKRRMNLVPFTITINKAQRDLDLHQKLVAEAPAILRWMIDGCLDWQERGLQQPECVMAATDQYLADQDSMLEWIESCCSVNVNAKGKSADLYASYKAFTERANEYVLSIRGWKSKLESRGITAVKSDGLMYLRGLKLKANPEQENLY